MSSQRGKSPGAGSPPRHQDTKQNPLGALVSWCLGGYSADATTAVGLAGLVLFVLLAVPVHARALAGLDLAVASAMQGMSGWPLDASGTVVGIAGAGEMSVLYGLAGAAVLWRAGLGYWSLAPLAFLLPTLLEFGLKSVLHQPQVPGEFHRHAYYPLVSLHLKGSFPSGHALRSAFFCAFLAVLLWSRRDALSRAAALLFIPLELYIAFTRIYMGDHWVSDVAAGLLLGASFALLVAPPVARRLARTTD